MSDKPNAAADTQTPAAPQPGTPEYDAAMAAKFDATNPQNTPETPQRPAHVPEKFWNAETGQVDTEAWARSYTELEQKQSAPKQEPQGQTQEPPKEGAPNQDDASAALATKGLDMTPLSQEFAQNGALSDASYKKLEDAGIPKPMVDAYIAGQQALVAQQAAAAHEVAGGKEQFDSMVKWAATGLTQGEIAAYDKAVTEGSFDEAKLAVAGLRARYEAANGREPGLLGGKPSNGGIAGYASTAEMTAEMKDPRYEKDPAYRARVQAKLAVTTAF